ncbi:MAG: hypothetical protein WCO56_12545 [Verrucomicrobiota bacterium]
MNEQRFFDLVMQEGAGQLNAAEREELQAWLTTQPNAKAEYAKLQEQARLAKQVSPMLHAMNYPAKVELPLYAEERLKTKVVQTFARPERPKPTWSWKMWLAMATCVLMVAIVAVRQVQPSQPEIQLAMLDTIGGVRGTGEDPTKAMTNAGLASTLVTFSDNAAAAKWRELDAKKLVVKVIYDRDHGKVDVLYHAKDQPVTKSFSLTDEQELPGVLREVGNWIKQQGQR